MIKYEDISKNGWTRIKVRLENKHVGTIWGSKQGGFQYVPKNSNTPGELFQSVEQVKKSLE